MRISFVTLGCKVNQYETQAMEKLLHAHGHSTVEPGQPADAVVINTCAVTGKAPGNRARLSEERRSQIRMP